MKVVEHKRIVEYNEKQDLFTIQEDQNVIFACYDFKKSFPEVLTMNINQIYNRIKQIFNF